MQEHQAAAVLMAYGISAAGKTYTIDGSRSEPGVLPRALDLLFQVWPQILLLVPYLTLASSLLALSPGLIVAFLGTSIALHVVL